RRYRAYPSRRYRRSPTAPRPTCVSEWSSASGSRPGTPVPRSPDAPGRPRTRGKPPSRPELRAGACCAVAVDKPRLSRYEADFDVEKRRKLGLPAQVLEQAGLAAGDRVHIHVRRDGRIMITPIADLLSKYAGAIPGIVAATRLEEQPDT